MASPAYEIEEIQIVELHMMDKRKYFPLAALSGFTIRGILYPFSLIKTRLQVQRHNAIYKGTFDAFNKIVKYEGISGLYKGFWITNLLVATSMSYIVTYENIRNYMRKHSPDTNTKMRSFVAGGCASLVGQTSMVPIDIVSQHLQMIGQKDSVSGKTMHVKSLDHLEISPTAYRTRMGVLNAIIKAVYRKDGIRGFYKGYLVSLAVYAPNSAMWWFFYDTYSNFLAGLAPVWMPRLLLQCMAAPLSGITATTITTPFDAIRARVQVENHKFGPTAKVLWREERFGIFTKGLSARLIQSISFSFFIILGYESIKRISLLDEYKDAVRW